VSIVRAGFSGPIGSEKVTGARAPGRLRAGSHEPEDLPAMRAALKRELEAMSEGAARIGDRKANFTIWCCRIPAWEHSRRANVGISEIGGRQCVTSFVFFKRFFSAVCF
jgi:hypothetical protein